MATNTPNLNLRKPAESDNWSVANDFNGNMDKLDEAVGELKIPPAYSGDCNSIAKTCVVYTTDSATNSPGAWNILSTTVYDSSSAISQIGVDVIHGTVKTRAKSSNGWSAWRTVTFTDNRGYADIEIPNGTQAGLYLVGTYTTTGIPSGASIISAQCMNSHASLCIVTGFATWEQNVYVYILQPVQVGDAVVRITWIT